ncbi:unnamed protein product, partial [Heterosigma akashiwo]
MCEQTTRNFKMESTQFVKYFRLFGAIFGAAGLIYCLHSFGIFSWLFLWVFGLSMQGILDGLVVSYMVLVLASYCARQYFCDAKCQSFVLVNKREAVLSLASYDGEGASLQRHGQAEFEDEPEAKIELTPEEAEKHAQKVAKEALLAAREAVEKACRARQEATKVQTPTRPLHLPTLPYFPVSTEENHLALYHMRLLPLEVLLTCGQIPRSDQKLVHFDFEEIIQKARRGTRKRFFVVFISHAWWERSKPSTPTTAQYKVLAEALLKLKMELDDPHVTVLCWLDYFSLDQDNHFHKLEGLKSLPFYIANSDVVLTPYTFVPDNNAVSADLGPDSSDMSLQASSSPLDYFEEDWCAGVQSCKGLSAYFDSAWCRLDLHLAQTLGLPRGGYDYFL